jgi:hypothetical protein
MGNIFANILDVLSGVQEKRILLLGLGESQTHICVCSIINLMSRIVVVINYRWGGENNNII